MEESKRLALEKGWSIKEENTQQRIVGTKTVVVPVQTIQSTPGATARPNQGNSMIQQPKPQLVSCYEILSKKNVL